MIPLRLKLRNFMPYRGDLPAFSLAGIHTACISGENGAGKSSLIDAITWALWGKARSGADDDLISVGAEETEVEFDFSVAGQIYKSIRKRTRPKKITSSGQTTLDLISFSDGGLNNISGDTLSQTQEIIKRLLHMDYDTFINSAYLRQGHADEFSRQTPARRKEVLASILKLDQYDILADSARNKFRDCQAKRELIEFGIQEIQKDLAVGPQLTEDVEIENKRLAEVNILLTSASQQLESLKRSKHDLDLKREQLKNIRSDISERRRQLQAWQQQSEQSRVKIQEYEQLLNQADEIEEGFARYDQARQTIDQASRKLQKLNNLNEKKNRLEKVIETERLNLLNRKNNLAQNIKQLEIQAELKTVLVKELDLRRSEYEKLKKLEQQYEAQEESIKQLRDKISAFEAGISQAGLKVQEIDSREKIIAQDTGACCPLCEKPLSEGERALILEKYHEEKTAVKDDMQNSIVSRANLQKQHSLKSNELLALRTEHKKQQGMIEKEIGVLTHRITECEQARDKLNIEIENRNQIVELLESEDYAKIEQQELKNVLEQIILNNYDSRAYDIAGNNLSRYEIFARQKLLLDEARERIETEKHDLAQSSDSARQLAKRIEQDVDLDVKLEAEIVSLGQVDEKLSQAEEQYRQADIKRQAVQETVYRLQEKLDNISRAQEKLAEKQKQLSKTQQEEEIFRQLVQAFGKKIPGLLIEKAIPEIENEANRILGRMTDNRMTLKIESQRKKKSGDMIDTLEINIADDAGTRNYEMYSGGEAFRIDFALRIALSRLLANRSGAPLPTLIIDEGFGTQDNVGLEKIKEAINSIQNDFEVILVITHIDELKNAFNTRIEVTKTQEGSMVSII